MTISKPTLAGLVLAAVATGVAPAADRPNIVFIVADDLGYGDVGVHGCKAVPTPNIDALAKAGTRCTSGYVSGPYCSPTRAGLLTGRYQQRFGHEFNPGTPTDETTKIGLSLKETTLPTRLKAVGYKTGLVGKWHLGNGPEFVPTARGFDESFGFLGGAHSYLKAGAGVNVLRRGTQPVEESEYLTDAFGREAVAFIDRHAKEPFFLYLAFNAVHAPLEEISLYSQRFRHLPDGKRKTYAAMLAALDDNVGRVLAKLKAAGLEDNTLVAFISDNGGPPKANGSSNGPLRGAKATTWEGGIRVPYFVRWPNHVPAGATYDAPVIQLDLTATALAVAGAAVPPAAKLDGVDLLPYLSGKTAGAPHDALYWRFGGQLAIRAGDWKLVKAAEPGVANPAIRRGKATPDGALLFDLNADLGERTDVAAKQPEKVKELAALWQRWNAELVEPAWGPPRQAQAK